MPRGINPRIAPTMNYGIVGTSMYGDIVNGATQLMGLVNQGSRDKANAEFRRDKFEQDATNSKVRNELMRQQTAKIKQEISETGDQAEAQKTSALLGQAVASAEAFQSLPVGQAPSDQVASQAFGSIQSMFGTKGKELGLQYAPADGGIKTYLPFGEQTDAFLEEVPEDLVKFFGVRAADGKVVHEPETIGAPEMHAIVGSRLTQMDPSDDPTSYNRAFEMYMGSSTSPQQRMALADNLNLNSLAQITKWSEGAVKKIDTRHLKDESLYSVNHEAEVQKVRDTALEATKDLQVLIDSNPNDPRAARDNSLNVSGLINTSQMKVETHQQLAEFQSGTKADHSPIDLVNPAEFSAVINKEYNHWFRELEAERGEGGFTDPSGWIRRKKTGAHGRVADGAVKDLREQVFPRLNQLENGGRRVTDASQIPNYKLQQSLLTKINNGLRNPDFNRTNMLSTQEKDYIRQYPQYLSRYFSTFMGAEAKGVEGATVPRRNTLTPAKTTMTPEMQNVMGGLPNG